MGSGRRQSRKQGPPEPLSEDHFAKLKRKAGLVVEKSAADAAPAKKRKTAKPTHSNIPTNGAGISQKSEKSNGTSKTAAGLKGERRLPEKAKASAPDSDASSLGDDWDEDQELQDEFGDVELEDGLSSLDEDGGADLGDGFLDSDEDVYDSGAEQDKTAEFAFSEDEDESDAEEKLTAANIEGLSRRLDRQLEQDAADADAELQDSALQTNIAGDRPHLLDGDEDAEDGDGGLASKTKALLAPDLQLLRNRITETVRVLDDFAKLGEEGRTRSEYKAQLLTDICAYYGYSEYLAEMLFSLFPPREAFAFFEANETARPVVIRTNTLRASRRSLAQALINRGVVLEPVGKWSKVGLQIFESGVPIGATPEYLAGHYILQAASSFLPVMALGPIENERVLDMAAAPGGKTTYMAAMMKNTGCIFANDPSKARARGLIANVHRLGCRNVVVSNYDAREFPRVIGGFDRVLLDAPCSGTGVISKDPSVKTNKTERDFMVLPHTQKQLLLAAIDSVNHASKTGGFLVYSTCSVTVAENEEVVQYALKRRPNVRLVDTDLPFGKEGFVNYKGKHFDASMKLTRRYYPHTYNIDGFFVAKFQKVGVTPPNAVLADQSVAAKATQAVSEEEEAADQAAVAGDGEDANGYGADSDFGGFDDDEDDKYMERAKRNALRRRGIDPRAAAKTTGKGEAKRREE